MIYLRAYLLLNPNNQLFLYYALQDLVHYLLCSEIFPSNKLNIFRYNNKIQLYEVQDKTIYIRYKIHTYNHCRIIRIISRIINLTNRTSPKGFIITDMFAQKSFLSTNPACLNIIMEFDLKKIQNKTVYNIRMIPISKIFKSTFSVSSVLNHQK